MFVGRMSKVSPFLWHGHPPVLLNAFVQGHPAPCGCVPARSDGRH